MKNFFLLLLLVIIGFSATAQDSIRIKNGSFEINKSEWEKTHEIDDWTNCGLVKFPNHSPADILPNGMWEVTQEAFDGETYLGIVVRDDETWESIGQKLEQQINKSKCYRFCLYLSQSSNYKSYTVNAGRVVNFVKPICLKIWMGHENCETKELIYKSVPIDHEEWKEYQVEFTATDDYDFIMLEAYYNTPVAKAYCGHVLVDRISDIRQCKENQ